MLYQRARFLLCKNGGKNVPTKPMRPCSHSNCPNLTNERFCEEHKRQENKRYEKYDRDPNVHRKYGRTWKRIRDNYKASNPLCEECLKQGRYSKTE